MANFGKKRFPKSYQKKVGQNARELLHKNSEELVEILKDHNVIQDDMTVFEMGAAGARNLWYIWKENKSVKLYANDLFEKESREQMHNDIKELITFYEGDSENIFNESKVENLDLLLVSDHFMHLQYEKVDNILTKILSDWTPRHMIIREVKKEYEAPDHPRLFHKYHRLLDKYDLVHERDSKQTDQYFIWLLKRK